MRASADHRTLSRLVSETRSPSMSSVTLSPAASSSRSASAYAVARRVTVRFLGGAPVATADLLRAFFFAATPSGRSQPQHARDEDRGKRQREPEQGLRDEKIAQLAVIGGHLHHAGQRIL